PIEEDPEIKYKGKTLHIEFEEELKDSTTYNIYFGNSVQDYNEGNPIETFQFVLSTGSYIDSLSIEGQVLNSYNLLPEEGVFVMLYNDFEDSIPIKDIPVYISKTNEDGFFHISNISNNQFKLFCLRDFNKNYLFDLPNEDIAYLDSLVGFELLTETKIDTIFKSDSSIIDSVENFQDRISEIDTDTLLLKQVIREDSLKVESDSLMYKPEKEIDSIIIESNSYFPVQNYILRLFTEEREVQYLANNTRDTKQKIEIVFNKSVKDSVVFAIADTIIEKEWYIKEVSLNNDSITYWLKDSSIYKKESLVFAITYQKEDSNLVYQWNTDTLNLRFFEQKKKKREQVDTSLKYNLNIKNRGTLDLNSQLNFLFETPLQSYDTSKINLFAVIDTVEFQVAYNFTKDSIKLRKYQLSVDWCEDTVYRLEIYPKAFTDIYESVNDTNIIEFQTQKRDFYGKILADITGIDSSFQVICQLILPGKDTETIYRERIITENQIVEFDFLPPKEFMFKVIIDKNLNIEWDTGEYLKHIQPEEVLYYEEKITVRSNWDIEINFNVNK
ncbi:MAG: hypothetical protein KAQ75_02740, partial [Bacteroidales bacterium]|nr:hypothetical protein [Bacteroidales bacterium]